MAGKVPRLFITDGLDQYHIAFKRVFRTLEGPRSIHIRGIHIRNLLCNTNKQERFHGELAGHFKYARGINKEAFPDIPHGEYSATFIKPHAGIAAGPAEAAGIDVRGADRWRTLIQNAVSAA